MTITMEERRAYQVLGVMSGTSLDGLDLALCRFYLEDQWRFELIQGATMPFDQRMARRLRNAHLMDAREVARLNVDFGSWIGDQVKHFLGAGAEEKPEAIASHGQTVFHEPKLGLTFQIGSGAEIAARTGIPCICDFRTTDVALGGQGAPLVPIGDQLLFGEYAACLNLGGFANISIERGGKRMAWDICPVNFVLDRLAAEAGWSYDVGGKLASSGKVNEGLLQRLESLSFYKLPAPRSLGREWYEAEFLPLLDENIPLEDRLRTVVEHIALRITAGIGKAENVLVTGGGVFNTFLLQRVQDLSLSQLVIPNEEIVSFKEAIIFAFLGVRYLRNEVSVLSSVTGAERDHIGGCMYK